MPASNQLVLFGVAGRIAGVVTAVTADRTTTRPA
jgi:hypothetical protein